MPDLKLAACKEDVGHLYTFILIFSQQAVVKLYRNSPGHHIYEYFKT